MPTGSLSSLPPHRIKEFYRCFLGSSNKKGRTREGKNLLMKGSFLLSFGCFYRIDDLTFSEIDVIKLFFNFRINVLFLV